MPRKAGTAPRGNLPELELECLKALWDEGELSVREVRDRLLPRRPLAYTTVLTVLDRLAQKGAVTRRKSGRAHRYQAAVSRTVARDAALARLLEHYFGGSRELLLEHLRPGASAAAARAALPQSAAGGEEAGALDPTLL